MSTDRIALGLIVFSDLDEKVGRLESQVVELQNINKGLNESLREKNILAAENEHLPALLHLKTKQVYDYYLKYDEMRIKYLELKEKHDNDILQSTIVHKQEVDTLLERIKQINKIWDENIVGKLNLEAELFNLKSHNNFLSGKLALTGGIVLESLANYFV